MITTKIVTLNNKNRQGLYVYIKDNKHTGKYYKFNGQIIDPYIQFYKDKYINKKPKGTLQQYIKTYQNKITNNNKELTTPITRQADQYLRRIKNLPTIKQSIKRGITATTIQNAYKITQQEINQKKQDLLKNLVIDKQLLNILITPNNMQKIKERLEYRIELKDTQNNTLIKTNTFNKIPEQVINETTETIPQNTKNEHQQYRSEIKNKLENLEYPTYENIKSGIINKIQITIIFRKAQ